MPKDLNNVVVSGTLPDDPEIKYTGSGTALCTLRIENEKWYRTSDGWDSRTSYFSATVWGQAGEQFGERFRAGDRIWINGSLTVNSWEDQSGERQYSTEIRVDDFGPMEDTSQGPQRQQDPQPEPDDQRRQQQNQRGGQQRGGGGSQQRGGGGQQRGGGGGQQQNDQFEPDDELPF